MLAFFAIVPACLHCWADFETKKNAEFSAEELISRLQSTELAAERQSQNGDATPLLLPLGAPVNIGPRDNPIVVDAPAMAELVRRGVGALPVLLSHLSDARPTQVVFAIAPRKPAENGRPVISTDDYDCRYTAKERQPSGVNTKQRVPLGGDGTYRLKVGDLCFIAVGEIVDRKLYVIGWHGMAGMWPSGAGIGAKIGSINSPIECPALAAATRSDWTGLTEKEHERSLLDKVTPTLQSVRIDLDALDRLLYYYPSSGMRTVEEVLRTNKHAWAKVALVDKLAPFRSAELDAMLYRVFEEAVASQALDLKTQPEGTWDPGVESLGSTLPLDCARLLVHQGHDDEFRAFALDRMVRIREADRLQPAKPTLELPSPGVNTLHIVHNYELECCQDLLDHLNDSFRKGAPEAGGTEAEPKATVGAHVTIQSVTLGPGSYGPLFIDLRLSEPDVARIRAARTVVTRALDDIGVVLEPTEPPRFSYISVGRTSEDVMWALPPPSLAFALTTPSRLARALAILQGWLEVIDPDLDPLAVAKVDDVKSKFGEPLVSNAFLNSGIEVTVFDKQACEKFLREKGHVFTGPNTPAAYGIPVPGQPGSEITELDLAVLIKDQKGRLISTEFRSKDGSPLRYNHNGWSHYGDLPGTRLDLYRFEGPLPEGAQMVCLLATPQSLVVAPFKFADVALP